MVIMIAYIPIPDNTVPSQRTIDSLLAQVDAIETIECGSLRDKRDRARYTDIGRGRITAMNRAVERGDEFFVINNSGALHKNHEGIARCVTFLKENKDFGGVALPKAKMVRVDFPHVAQECVVYRTSAVKDLEKYIKWDEKYCECMKIRGALKFKGFGLNYLEKEVNHLQDIGQGFIPKGTNGQPVCN